MKFHWGDYLFGCWAILFLDHMAPGCFDYHRWALWVLPIMVLGLWIYESAQKNK